MMKQYTNPEVILVTLTDDLLTITSSGEQVLGNYDITMSWDEIFG